jgi:hypothetical protein
MAHRHKAQPAAEPPDRPDAEEHPMPEYPDDRDRDHRRDRDVPPNPLADLLRILPPETRSVLRSVAEEATYAALRAGGGPNPLAAAAAAATRLLSDTARQRPEAAPSDGAKFAAEAAEDGPTRLRSGVGPAQTTVPAPAAAGSFVRLPQPGTEWWQFVRHEAVVAVKSPENDRCVVMLADGRGLEVGGSADAAAQQIPGLVRLTQPGTQRCLYVRPAAVVAITAPSQGCVLHLSNGRELEAGEAAAVATGLIAGAG